MASCRRAWSLGLPKSGGTVVCTYEGSPSIRAPKRLRGAPPVDWICSAGSQDADASTMRRWPVTLLAAGAARATPGARSSSPRELLVADAVEALYELPPLPAQTDARELTTYEEAWTRRLPRLEDIPARYFAGLASPRCEQRRRTRRAAGGCRETAAAPPGRKMTDGPSARVIPMSSCRCFHPLHAQAAGRQVVPTWHGCCLRYQPVGNAPSSL